MEGEYTGGDILAALENAEHYAAFLTELVRRSAGGIDELIDFGAGVGTYAKRLRSEGFRVVCIEPDDSQRQRLLDEGFEAWPAIDTLPDNAASLVFSLNALEHINEDASTVAELWKKSRPGGTVLIYVPAFNCLWSSLDDQVKHCRRYTKRSLRELVQQAGFSVEELRYADALGFVTALVFRGLRRNAGAITPRSITFYDRWVFRPSRVLDKLFHPFFGKNVYVVARKVI
jgi:SAM-dependent methyltransferase